jgi:molecular chaperone DnaK (HSP70)
MFISLVCILNDYFMLSRTCLIYRCGGSTLDVSIVEVRGGMYSVKSAVHRKIGGDKFTQVVANFLADEFQK